MPYIIKDQRKKYDSTIDNLIVLLKDASMGEINYCLSKLIWRLFDLNKSYANANNLFGMLHAVSTEFYRRKISPFEDEKMKINGDLENEK